MLGGRGATGTTAGRGRRPAAWVVALLVAALALPGGAPRAVAAQDGVKGGLAGASFTRDVLPGGLVVLVEERPGSGLVALEVTALAGARYESGPTAGAAP